MSPAFFEGMVRPINFIRDSPPKNNQKGKTNDYTTHQVRRQHGEHNFPVYGKHTRRQTYGASRIGSRR